MSAQPAASHRPPVVQPEDRLEMALDRLRRATDMVEAALSRRSAAQKDAAAFEREMEVLFEDRSRLVHELDQVKARASRLDAASAEVFGRLDAVLANLRAMLQGP